MKNTKNTINVDNNKKSAKSTGDMILRSLLMVLKIMFFPVYLFYYLVKKFTERGRYSIRLGLSIMHLKIIFKTLVLTGFFIFTAYGAYRAYPAYKACNTVAEQAVQQAVQQVERQSGRQAGQKEEQQVKRQNGQQAEKQAERQAEQQVEEQDEQQAGLQAGRQDEQQAVQQPKQQAGWQAEQLEMDEASGPIPVTTEVKCFAIVYDKDKNAMFSIPAYIYSSLKGIDTLQGAHDEAGGKLKYRNIAGFTVIQDKYLLVLNMVLFPRVWETSSREINQSLLFNIYADVTSEINSIKHLLMIILLVDGIGLIFAFALSLGAARDIVSPIEEMAGAARSISENNMNVRLNVSGSKSELKGLAMTFNEMMDRIEDAYNRQKQFVSDVSHELRTPIAVLQGYIDMLNRWGKDDREVLQESLDALKNETENMKNLVENLLFLARNDRGKLDLQKERFSLTDLLLETIREMKIIDEKHKVTWNINEGIEVYADRDRIKQAIRVFLDNAIKYTPEGGEIAINLTTEKKNAVIEVLDTGIGMTVEEMKHIFDRFYRSDKSRKREKGGHGLGLTIAKTIILGHKGKINVRSKPGEGTRIRFFLHLA